MAGAMYGKIGEEPDGDEGGDDLMPMADEEESDDPIVRLARKAFPESDWTPERASALEELICHCAGMDYGPPSSKREGGMGMGGDKGKADIILALGPPKRK